MKDKKMRTRRECEIMSVTSGSSCDRGERPTALSVRGNQNISYWDTTRTYFLYLLYGDSGLGVAGTFGAESWAANRGCSSY